MCSVRSTFHFIGGTRHDGGARPVFAAVRAHLRHGAPYSADEALVVGVYARVPKKQTHHLNCRSLPGHLVHAEWINENEARRGCIHAALFKPLRCKSRKAQFQENGKQKTSFSRLLCLGRERMSHAGHERVARDVNPLQHYAQPRVNNFTISQRSLRVVTTAQVKSASEETKKIK